MKPNLMSPIIAGAMAALLFCGAAIAGTGQTGSPHSRRAASLSDVPGKTPIMVVSSATSDSAMQFTYTFPEVNTRPAGTTYGGKSLETIELGNALQSGNEGEPVLPVVPVQFIIPEGYTLKSVAARNGEVRSLSGSFRVRHGEAPVPIAPGARPRSAIPDDKIYNSDNPFPKNGVEVVTVQKKRGVSIAIVNLHPVVYHPRSGRVSWYRDIMVDVSLTKDRTTAALRPRTSGISPATLGIENPEALFTYQDGPMSPAGTAGPLGGICDPARSYRYVIITSDAMKNATTDYTVRDLVAHRQAVGMTATIVTTESIYADYAGIDNAEKVRNFIIDAYTNWETDFILLGGDIAVVPMRKLYSGAEIPSDLYFQCLDGTYNANNNSLWGEPTDGPGGTEVDLMSELSIGRASAETAGEMANFVYKTLAYENAPATAPFLRNTLMVGEYLGFGGVAQYATASMEEIRLGTSEHGYTTAGFAALPYFPVDTLYDSPSYSWPATEILSRMNSDRYGIFNHFGHANHLYVTKFLNSDADALTNTNPFFAYSQGCDPGNFEEDCIAEHLTTSTRSGAFAVVFNSRAGFGMGFSTDGPNQRINRQFWDAFFNENLTCLGDLNADSHEDNLWNIDNTSLRWCYLETNLLGDPGTPMRGRITGPHLAYASHTMSDAAGGNGDGLINPGETIDLTLSLSNFGKTSADGVTATVSATDPYVSTASTAASFGAISCCGVIKATPDPVRISIDPSCPMPRTVQLLCTMQDDKGAVWTSTFSITVVYSSQVSGNVRTVAGSIPLAGAAVSFAGPLSGTGADAPSINLTPASIDLQLDRGGAATRTLALSNSGVSDLVWNISSSSLLLRSNEIHDAIPGVQDAYFDCDHGDLYCEYWQDGGNDAFDRFGNATLSVAGESTPICMSEGIYSYVLNGYQIRVRNDFAENHIYRSIIEPEPGETSVRSDVTINYTGEMGSDGAETVFFDSVLISGTWVRYFVNQDYDYPNTDPRVVFLIVPSRIEHLGRVSYWRPNDGFVTMEAANISLPATVYIIPSYYPLASIKSWLQNELSLKSPRFSLSAQSGTTGPGLSTGLQVSFSTTGLAAGIYSDTLIVTHNDPQKPALFVPMTLEVLPDQIPGRSRIFSIGPAMLPKAEGMAFRMWNIRIGSALSGTAAGQRYRVILK